MAGIRGPSPARRVVALALALLTLLAVARPTAAVGGIGTTPLTTTCSAVASSPSSASTYANTCAAANCALVTNPACTDLIDTDYKVPAKVAALTCKTCTQSAATRCSASELAKVFAKGITTGIKAVSVKGGGEGGEATLRALISIYGLLRHR